MLLYINLPVHDGGANVTDKPESQVNVKPFTIFADEPSCDCAKCVLHVSFSAVITCIIDSRMVAKL